MPSPLILGIVTEVARERAKREGKAVAVVFNEVVASIQPASDPLKPGWQVHATVQPPKK